jgi:hypothetical protein
MQDSPTEHAPPPAAAEGAVELRNFVFAAKQGGAQDSFLLQLLQRQGWPEGDIYAALADYWQQATGVAMPRRSRPAESARDTFLWLLSFLALGIWVTALGTVLFQLIDHWMPDDITSRGYRTSRVVISWSMAALAVSFPLYLGVMRALVRDAASVTVPEAGGLRKWLTYFLLFVTAATVLGDLIGVVGVFLMGELSGRFLVKSLVILLLAGGIFVYYLGSLSLKKRSPAATQPFHRWFAWAASVCVVAAFLVGMSIAGQPGEQRRIQADQRRLSDLQGIARGLAAWRNYQMPVRRGQTAAQAGVASDVAQDPATEIPLPASLQDAISHLDPDRLTDPETQQPYGYEVRSANTYALCAEFAASGPERPGRAYTQTGFWRHPSGRHCFVIDATKPVPW